MAWWIAKGKKRHIPAIRLSGKQTVNDKLWGASRIAAKRPTRATCYKLFACFTKKKIVKNKPAPNKIMLAQKQTSISFSTVDSLVLFDQKIPASLPQAILTHLADKYKKKILANIEVANKPQAQYTEHPRTLMRGVFSSMPRNSLAIKTGNNSEAVESPIIVFTTSEYLSLVSRFHGSLISSVISLLRLITYRVGGRVAPAVLPHHRTCGSASGGSLNTLESARCIKQRHQTQTIKV